ncbi:MAG: hypothetical protein OXN83_04060 [Oligoflexia bacterium]|nr:hypothetical protein [Oligoflexia bacterium]
MKFLITALSIGALFSHNAQANTRLRNTSTAVRATVQNNQTSPNHLRNRQRGQQTTSTSQTSAFQSQHPSAVHIRRMRRQAARQTSQPLTSQYGSCKEVDLSSLAKEENSETEGEFCFTCSIEKLLGFGEIKETAGAVQSKVFKDKLQKRVIGQIESKIFQAKILQACLTEDKRWFSEKKIDWSSMQESCNQKNEELKNSVQDNWSEMRIQLALIKPSVVNAEKIHPDNRTWFDSTPSHYVSDFSSLPRLSEEEIKKAEDIFIDNLSSVSFEGLNRSEVQQRLREGKSLYYHPFSERHLSTRDTRELKRANRNLRKKAKESYFEIMSNTPILAYLEGGNPNKQELSSAVSKMEEELKEILEKTKDSEVDMGLLLSFRPLVEELLKEDTSYCLVAEKAREQAEEEEEFENWMMLGAGVLAAVPCFITGPVGASICLGAGMSLGVVGYDQARSAREESIGRVFMGKEYETMAELAEREKEEMLAMLFLPLGAWGTTAVPARAASTTATRVMRRLAPSSRSSNDSARAGAGKNINNILTEQRGRLLSDYDSLLRAKPAEEQNVIMSAIIGMESKGMDKRAITERVRAAVSQCRAR